MITSFVFSRLAAASEKLQRLHELMSIVQREQLQQPTNSVPDETGMAASHGAVRSDAGRSGSTSCFAEALSSQTDSNTDAELIRAQRWER